MPRSDAPTRSELIREENDIANSPLPAWFRAPLRVSRVKAYRFDPWPKQTLTCAEHPTWHLEVAPSDVVFHARRHITHAHAGVPEPVDPVNAAVAELAAIMQGVTP